MAFDPKIYLQKKPECSSDTECYPDYWSIGFMNIDTGKHIILERTENEELDKQKLIQVMRKYRIYGFNWWHYDVPMICLAMMGASNRTLKQANDDIIVRKMRLNQFKEKYNIRIPDWFDHIDLFDPSPGVRLSLKKYGARMNTKRLAETPFSFDENANTPARRPKVRAYLKNDLQLTRELVLALREEILQRSEMSTEYGIDLRSKSDAQIAAALFGYEVQKRTGIAPGWPKVVTHSFKFKPPSFIKFETPQLQSVLRIVSTVTFEVKAGNKENKKEWGVVKLPKAIKDIKLRIGFTDYKMGLGGLHSKEKKRSFIEDAENKVVDRDVRGYYPELMLACGLSPGAVGDAFPLIFRDFVDNRTKYKLTAERLLKAGEEGKALKYVKRSGTLKIVNNGTFGQTGNPYCFLYAPNLMVQTTLTGQLSILMLIERLELKKFTVISANTDGIVTIVPRALDWLFKSIIFDWECDTSLVTEETLYAGVYSRDVNSYIALPHDYKTNPKAKIKRKGLFAKSGLSHDPTYDVCSDAVVAFLTKGTPIEDTVYECDDFTKFIGVRQVAGGASKNGIPLGKMVRWYFAQEEGGYIENNKGDRVAGTTGAKPVMDLPDDFPDDVDMEWYVREAYARLDDIGLATKYDQDRIGYVWASLPKQKTLHLVDMSTRMSMCERHEKQVREAWIEHKTMPDNMRVCKTCSEERGYVDEEINDDIVQ